MSKQLLSRSLNILICVFLNWLTTTLRTLCRTIFICYFLFLTSFWWRCILLFRYFNRAWISLAPCLSLSWVFLASSLLPMLVPSIKASNSFIVDWCSLRWVTSSMKHWTQKNRLKGQSSFVQIASIGLFWWVKQKKFLVGLGNFYGL